MGTVAHWFEHAERPKKSARPPEGDVFDARVRSRLVSPTFSLFPGLPARGNFLTLSTLSHLIVFADLYCMFSFRPSLPQLLFGTLICAWLNPTCYG